MNTKSMEQFDIMNSDMLENVEGGIKNLLYAMVGGAGAGASLGAAICSPTLIGSAPCALVGGLYGSVAGSFGAALDTRR